MTFVPNRDPAALRAQVSRLTRDLDDARALAQRAVEQQPADLRDQITRLQARVDKAHQTAAAAARERDQLRAEVERLRAGVENLHRPEGEPGSWEAIADPVIGEFKYGTPEPGEDRDGDRA